MAEYKSSEVSESRCCPCGRDLSFSDCCGRFIDDAMVPSTAEDLMRSRYTAYTLANIDYIVKTMVSPAADGFDPLSALVWAKSCHWQKLDVIRHQENKVASQAIVEFSAYYMLNNKQEYLHEVSEFCFKNGRWFYRKGR